MILRNPLYLLSKIKLLYGTKLLYSFLLLLFFTGIGNAQDPYVSGPDSVCFSIPYTFTVENADPTIEYEWTYTTFGFGLSPFNYWIDDQTMNSIELDIYSVGGTGIRTLKLCAFEVGTFNNHALCKEFTFFPRIQDMLVFPEDICDFNDKTLPYDIRYIDRFVCLGDTTRIGVANYVSGSHETTLPYQLFTPDRLALLNGEMIDYDDYGFTVVWDQVGSKPIRLKTTNLNDCISTLTTDVIVRDISSIPILGDATPDQPIVTCVNSTVNLEADASLSSALSWVVSDGRSFTTKEINLSFDEPGTYIVELSETGECTCSKPTFKTIIVEDGQAPNVECAGTTCTGEEVTYYSSDFCDQYDWVISPEGTIIDGGGSNDNYVTVIWNTSPSGNVYLATPGCFANACRESVDVNIPIIDNNIEIEGLQLACYGQSIQYSVPAFDGTTYNWNVASYYGSIVSGQGTNSIVVKWKSRTTENGPTSVSVSFNNCFIDCQGFDSHDVEILPPMAIYYFEQARCKDANLSATARYDIIPDWEVTAPDNSVVTYTAQNSLDITLTQVGNYQILVTAPAGATCNDTYQFTVPVSPDPSPPSSIIESEQVCEGVNIQYSIPGLGLYDIVHWAVFDGDLSTAVYTSESKTINYQWQSSGPYQIRARIENGATGCVSEATTFDLQNNTELVGTDEICEGLTGTYFINIPKEKEVVWTITPNNGGSITRVTNDSLYVVWNTSGVYEINAEACGVSSSVFTTVIQDIVLPLDSGPSCPDEIYKLTGSIPSGVNMEIFDDADDLVGTTLPLSLAEGYYTVLATNDAGCEYEDEFEIVILEEPKVRVSSPQPNVYCQVIPFPITIVVDTDGTYTFEWFRNNVPLGLTGTSITTSDFGSYHVIVTDSNGCTAQSNSHNIVNDCGTASPINFSLVNLDCNNLIFEVDPPYSSTNFTWFFDDPDSGPDNVVSGLSVTHTFTYAGYYYVIVNGNANEAGVEIIEIGTVADFEFANGCAGSSIPFTNLSSYIPGFDNSDYLWGFGDPASGASNSSTLESPTHIYSSPGNYLVTLQTTDVNGCVSTAEKTITIFDGPNIDILSRDLICTNLSSVFEASVYDDNYDYSWDFDDPNSGPNNTSLEYSVSHVFSMAGFYDVKLMVRDDNGCEFLITKQVEIVDSDLSGDIAADLAMPKCPNDVVTLTAPPALMYQWSTGASTSTISVVANGNYYVTLTNAAGCTYTPPAFNVSSVDLYSTFIIGQKRSTSQGGSTTHYDSLVICIGEEFDLFTREIPNVTYLWSTAETGTSLFFETYFSGLTVGTYDYSLQVVDIISGCSIEHEYKVIVNPLPAAPSISKDLESNCEGNLYTLSVDNPQPDLLYSWQDGRIGQSIETRKAGDYYVEAINNQGCIAESNTIVISPVPTGIGWMTGCKEVCFPDEFCLTLNNQFTYELYMNGGFLSSISPTTSSLQINGPGDYSLVVTSSGGCSVETGYLTLNALEDDQHISGLVYYDENDNGLFDGNDVLLEDVVVNLLAGNTILASTTTDSNGMYEFFNFDGANHSIAIDVSNLNYTFEGAMDSLLVFENCIEDKEIDFPLVSDCFVAITRIDSLVCSESTVTIGGVDYGAGDVDTLIYNLNANCDSTVIVSVAEVLDPEVELVVTPTCMANQTGEVLITILQGNDLSFSVDDDVVTTTTPMFNDLSAGDHVLNVYNSLGCEYSIPFEIVAIQPPDVMLETTPTCLNESIGILTIQELSGNITSFTINGDAYTTETTILNLPSGIHNMIAYDDFGCEYIYPFEITTHPMPEYNIEQENSCDGQSNGSIAIDVISGNNVVFALDVPIDWVSDVNFDELAPGDYVLYSLSEFGCIESQEFTVGSIAQPLIDVSTIAACEDLNGGTVEITTSSDGVSYSLDGSSFDTEPMIDNILPGNHILYYQSEEGCIYEAMFDIIELESPEVITSVSPTCLQNDNGTLSISVLAGTNLEFSLDGATFSNNLNYTNLFAGEDTLFIKNEVDCIYPIPFVIPNLPAPEITINTSNTCKGIVEGSMDLDVLVGTQLQFSIDNISFGTDVAYADLDQGEYTLYVLDTLGCSYEFPFTIEEFENPEVDMEVGNACESGLQGSLSIVSMNGVTATYAIDDPSGWSNVEMYDNIEIGQHMLYFLSEFGCLDSLPFTIGVIDLPTIDLLSTPVCEDNQLGIVEIMSDQSGLMYSLDGINFTDQLMFDELDMGNYTLYYQTMEGCVLEEIFDISMLPSPNLNVEVKPTCEGETTGEISIENLDGQDLMYSIDAISFDSNTEFNELSAGQYLIQIQNDAGCIYEQSININESPLPSLALDSYHSCPEENTGSILIDTEANNELIVNGLPVVSNVVENLMPGTYSVMVRDSLGCETIESISLDELPMLDVVAPEFDLDCYETEVVIIPEIRSHSGDLNYLWHNGSTENQLTSISSGSHAVTISDECSEVEFDWSLNISTQIEDEFFFSPNIFSPNDDGVNDCFEIVANPLVNISSYKLLIFDRWGSLLFEANDISDCWEGDYENEDVVPGVYVYILEIGILQCDELVTERKIGDVTVFR